MFSSDYFQGKKVTVMGLGLLGRSVGDAAYLAEAGAEVIITDLKIATELAPSVKRLQTYPNVTFVLGEHRPKDFKGRDFILVSAGVPLASEYLQQAKSAGVPLKQSAALFVQMAEVPIIGVTGTRGKSTVTHMIYHVLTATQKGQVLLGGNLRGLSNLQLLKADLAQVSFAVMELDSWQLQGFGWAGLSPRIAVFTNFMADHQNYYASMDDYFADKANIFSHQGQEDTLVTTAAVLETAKTKGLTFKQKVTLTNLTDLGADCILKIPGEHNRQNAALAAGALRAAGIPDELIFSRLTDFPGVEGRLQYLGNLDGVKIYNDNNATTPVATTLALKAVANDKNVVLICGGSDKGLALDELAKQICADCRRVIVYSGSGSEKLKQVLSPAVDFVEHDTLVACVEAALAFAEPGTVILFSPGFASFGHEYKNEYDRNDNFLALLKDRL